MVVLVVLGAGLAGLGVFYLSAAGGSPGGEPVNVVIQPGWSGARIADQLESQEVVSSSLAFRLFMKLRGVTSDLRAGEYELRSRMPFSALLRRLQKGPAVSFVKLTIPEGLTVSQVAELVGRSTHISGQAFAAAANSATIRPSILPEGINSLEGFLYPSTYFVIEKETAEDIVRRLVSQFEKSAAGIPWPASENLGRTAYEILIVASMIEEEAKVSEERPLVSAVIHNRLRRGMKLEIDATVQYAVGKYGRPLTEDDLNVDSPYNTRRYAGLPPGPIASPRFESILAALNPANSNALYYVLTEDCRHHLFTADYEEFLRAKSRQRADC